MDRDERISSKTDRQIWSRTEQNGSLRRRYITSAPSHLSFHVHSFCFHFSILSLILPLFMHIASPFLPPSPSLFLCLLPCDLTASCVIEDDREGTEEGWRISSCTCETDRNREGKDKTKLEKQTVRWREVETEWVREREREREYNWGTETGWHFSW